MPFIIENRVLNFNSNSNNNYFHLRPTLCSNNQIAMTLQPIYGSDHFGPVQISYSSKNRNDWSELQNIPSLGVKEIGSGVFEGISDVVPDFHYKSGNLLAIGHNLYYKDNHFLNTDGDASTQLQRFSVYSVRDSYGNWSERKRIYWEDFKNCKSFSCGCSQKVILPDGKIIIPFYIGYRGRDDRSFCSLLCDFDGKEITVLAQSNILEHPINRGLLEPSIAFHKNRFFLTLRAEDGYGYLSTSNDGLSWNPIQPWSWEDGSELIMSTTQQHWLRLGDKMYLVYTRKNGINDEVTRWRAPLFIAEFDAERLCLKKETEQVVFSMNSHPENSKSVGLVGNFHTIALSETEAVVTVGKVYPEIGFSSDPLLAHLVSK
jgi:hypothetical protein